MTADTTDAASRGQVSDAAAKIYEGFFVPALFQEWTARVVSAANLRPGERVLDVACGTGVLARQALVHVMPGGQVTGLDINGGMLSVARRRAPQIDWREGPAEGLPFDDGSFEAVVSQFGLMFFEDRVAALKEMWRVLSPKGRLAVAVWDKLENTPGYAAMVALLQELFGPAVAEGLRAPYCLGDRAALLSLFKAAGIGNAEVQTLEGSARFPSLEDWVHTDIKGWTLADRINNEQYQRLLKRAQKDLTVFTGDDGRVRFSAPAHIVTARKD